APRAVDRDQQGLYPETGPQVQDVFSLRLQISIHVARFLEDVLDPGGIANDAEIAVIGEEILGVLRADLGVALHEDGAERREPALDQRRHGEENLVYPAGSLMTRDRRIL